MATILTPAAWSDLPNEDAPHGYKSTTVAWSDCRRRAPWPQFSRPPPGRIAGGTISPPPPGLGTKTRVPYSHNSHDRRLVGSVVERRINKRPEWEWNGMELATVPPRRLVCGNENAVPWPEFSRPPPGRDCRNEDATADGLWNAPHGHNFTTAAWSDATAAWSDRWNESAPVTTILTTAAWSDCGTRPSHGHNPTTAAFGWPKNVPPTAAPDCGTILTDRRLVGLWNEDPPMAPISRPPPGRIAEQRPNQAGVSPPPGLRARSRPLGHYNSHPPPGRIAERNAPHGLFSPPSPGPDCRTKRAPWPTILTPAAWSDCPNEDAPMATISPPPPGWIGETMTPHGHNFTPPPGLICGTKTPPWPQFHPRRLVGR